MASRNINQPKHWRDVRAVPASLFLIRHFLLEISQSEAFYVLKGLPLTVLTSDVVSEAY